MDVAAGQRVLCLGARYGLDTAAAATLAQLLRQRGLTVEVMDAGTLLHGGSLPGRFDAVCLSYLDPGATRQARRLLLRARAPAGAGAHRPASACGARRAEEARRASGIIGADAVAGRLAEAVTATLGLLGRSRRSQRPAAMPPEAVAAAG